MTLSESTQLPFQKFKVGGCWGLASEELVLRLRVRLHNWEVFFFLEEGLRMGICLRVVLARSGIAIREDTWGKVGLQDFYRVAIWLFPLVWTCLLRAQRPDFLVH